MHVEVVCIHHALGQEMKAIGRLQPDSLKSLFLLIFLTQSRYIGFWHCICKFASRPAPESAANSSGLAAAFPFTLPGNE
jgi:hypothetical protein